MHGPCGPMFKFCPENLKNGLTLDGRMKITVVDDFVKTIRGPHRLVRRPLWRKMLNTALVRWEAAGLKFVVTEGDGLVSDWWFSRDPTHIIPKAIRLVRDRDDERDVDFAAYDSRVSGSIAAYNPGPEWWKKENRGAVTGVIGHEIGHCLGLDHGGGGVMSGDWKPNAHDLESVSRYYLGYNWA